MAYNYDPNFLVRNGDVVKKLIQIAESGELLVYEAENWLMLESRLRLVRSLLANMSRNLKGYEDIRGVIRCWTEFKDEKYRLFIGKPEHKVSGRPPGDPNRNWAAKYVPAELAGQTVFMFPDTLDGEETLATFVGKVSTLTLNINRAEAKVIELSDEAVAGFFTEIFDDMGWKVGRDGDTLILERK